MVDTILAWVLIGAACSLAGMIYPFRRGAMGLVVNAVVAIAGATALGAASWIALQGSAHERSVWSMTFAAVGALAAVVAVHLSYVLGLRARRR